MAASVPGTYVSPTLKDPNILIGRFRILPRADGAWIAYDPEAPPGKRTAAVAPSVDYAQTLAGELLEAERKKADGAGAL